MSKSSFVIKISPHQDFLDEVQQGGNPDVKPTIDWVLNNIKPLTTSMKIFGLYFEHDSEKLKDKNKEPIWRRSLDSITTAYPTIMVVLVWLNCVRLLTLFQTTDVLGLHLFWNFIILLWATMAALMQTSSYVACRTQKLHRTLADISEIKGCSIFLRNKAAILAAFAWFTVFANMGFIIYGFFGTNGDMDAMLAPVTIHVEPTQVSDSTYKINKK